MKARMMDSSLLSMPYILGPKLVKLKMELPSRASLIYTRNLIFLNKKACQIKKTVF